MPLWSGNIAIEPCYDGRVLTGVHQVAGEGLSVLSIKQSHRHCKFTKDPISQQSDLSCTKGIKARNSFWDLLKPDLRKVRGLECATTESVTQLFRAHSIKNAGKITYKKKTVRLLGPLIRKSKLERYPEVLVQNASLPKNICVLSSVCQEKEKACGVIKKGGVNPESTKDLRKVNATTEENPTFEPLCLTKNVGSPDLNNSVPFDDTFGTSILSSPDGSINRSDNTSKVMCILDNFTDNSISKTFSGNSYSTENISKSSEHFQEDINLKRKQLFVGPFDTTRAFSYQNILPLSTSENIELDLSEETKFKANENSNKSQQQNSRLVDFTAKYNPIVHEKQEQTLGNQKQEVELDFSEILQEMEDMKSYKNSEISSFFQCEEEFDNFSIFNKSSPIVIARDLEQFHNPNKTSSQIKIHILNHAGDPLNEIKHETDFLKEKIVIKTNQNQENIYIGENVIVTGNVNEISGDSTSAVLEPEVSFKNPFLNRKTLLNKDAFSNRDTGYFYWEDFETTFDNEVATKNACAMGSSYESAVVKLKFFETAWKELSESIEAYMVFHDSEINKNLTEQTNFVVKEPFSYCGNIYEKTIVEEAASIAQRINNFITNGCIPNEDITRVDCFIVEIVDDLDNLPSIGTINDFVCQEKTTNCSQTPKDDKNESLYGNSLSHESFYQECITGNEDEFETDHTEKHNVLFGLRANSVRLNNINNSNQKTSTSFLNQTYTDIHNELSSSSRGNLFQTTDKTIDTDHNCLSFKNQNNKTSSAALDDYQRGAIVQSFSEKFQLSKNDSKQQIIGSILTGKNCGSDGFNEANIMMATKFSPETSSLVLNRDKSFIPAEVSIFEKVSEKNENKTLNPEFIFSSPAVQMNLTKPITNLNKK